MTIDPDIIANSKIALAAFMGGLVRMFIRPAQNLTQAALLISSCVTCGFFMTRPIIDWWHLPVDYAGAIGALCGLLGLSLAEGMLRAVDGLNFKALLRALITKGNA